MTLAGKMYAGHVGYWQTTRTSELQRDKVIFNIIFFNINVKGVSKDGSGLRYWTLKV